MADQIDILWILLSAFLVFIMQAGFAFLESGLTRSKNSINVAIKNLTDLGVSILCYWAFGFALMFGASSAGFFGASGFLLSTGGVVWIGAFFIFQAMFCSTAATIVSGAVAERMRFASYIVSTILLATVIYPILGHWVWGGALSGEVSGWLGRLGFVDFAGSTVVHSTGGWLALAVLLIIGPRTGRFGSDGRPRAIPASSIPAAVVGVLLLWFGWFGFNGGSTFALSSDVPQILINTALAAAAGMVGTLAMGWPIYRIPDVTLVLNGALAGLVAITAPAPFVTEAQAVAIGAIGGAVMLLSVFGMERLKIDDAVGAIPVHLVAGVWGTLAVALFGNLDLLGTGLTRIQQLGVQALGTAAAGLWAFGVSIVVLYLINRVMPLRVTPEQETSGLNVAEHGASTELYDLFSVMETQKTTGDLSLRVPEEPFTEVGQIARAYNQVLGSLEENLVARTDYQQILDNVSDGLLLVDRDLVIGPSYSKALESILGVNDIQGRSIIDVLSPMVAAKTRDAAREFLDLMFSPKVDYRTVLKVNPLKQVEVFHTAGGSDLENRYLQFAVQRVLNVDRQVHRLMILIRDVTEQVQLSEEVEAERLRSRGEMELFYRILHVEPPMLREFLETCDTHLSVVNRTLEAEEGAMRDRLVRMQERLHSLKGDATLLNLDFIAEKAHAFEDRIASLMTRGDEVSSENFLALAIELSELQTIIAKTRELTKRIFEFQSAFTQDNVSVENTDSSGVLLAVQQIVERTARDLGKKIQIITSDFDADRIPRAHVEPVRQALVQLARNAVVHGIETPERREENGKPATGTIRIATDTGMDGLTISFRDDGQGFDIPLLRAKIRVPDTTSDVDVIREVNANNVSSMDAADLHAGRGAGLSFVRRLMREVGGKLGITFRPGEYSEFRLTFVRETV